jgi:hypothetical protein
LSNFENAAKLFLQKSWKTWLAKSLIHISRASPSTSRDTTQIEVYLNNVEFYLMPKAQKFGKGFVAQWTKRLEKARAGATEEFTTGSTISKFLPRIPKDTPWVRVGISKDISRDTAEAIAGESGLLTDSQEKGDLLVYGQKEKLQRFVRKMTARFRSTKTSNMNFNVTVKIVRCILQNNLIEERTRQARTATETCHISRR